MDETLIGVGVVVILSEMVEYFMDMPFLRVSYWGHKILKSTSVDCNKINVVTVKVRIMMCVGIAG